MSTELLAKILVVDDHTQARESIAEILTHAGHHVAACASAAEALGTIEVFAPDVVLTDLQMPGMSGLELIQVLAKQSCEAQIVMLTAYASVSTAVEAMRCGAFDYIEKPFDADQLELLVQRALHQGDRLGKRSTMPPVTQHSSHLLGSSRAMRELRARIAQIASTHETVLITGESGTGKELVAKALHAASSRRAAPMVSVNCPALSPQLMESELFGHERGAFTSADAPRVGRFELAEGGTILLDEVTEIDLPLQAKLLRVLQERAFERVGSSRTQRADVRVVAATNRNLVDEVRAGRFRQDLYYRLAVVPLTVPPLRERQGDVCELAGHFLTASAQRLGTAPCRLDSSAMQLLNDYSWPGNVRELENIMTRASVLSVDRKISAFDLRPWLLENAELAPTTTLSATALNASSGGGTTSPRAGVKLDAMERQLIESTLQRYEGHRERTAKALGIGVRTLANKLRMYGYAPRAKVTALAA